MSAVSIQKPLSHACHCRQLVLYRSSSIVRIPNNTRKSLDMFTLLCLCILWHFILPICFTYIVAFSKYLFTFCKNNAQRRTFCLSFLVPLSVCMCVYLWICTPCLSPSLSYVSQSVCLSVTVPLVRSVCLYIYGVGRRFSLTSRSMNRLLSSHQDAMRISFLENLLIDLNDTRMGGAVGEVGAVDRSASLSLSPHRHRQRSSSSLVCRHSGCCAKSVHR